MKNASVQSDLLFSVDTQNTAECKKLPFASSSTRLHFFIEKMHEKMFENKLKNKAPFLYGAEKNLADKHKSSLNLSKDFFFNSWLVKKPLNLLFSIDQFVFEFSKKRYQQKKTGEFLKQLRERKKLSFFYGHLTKKQLIQVFEEIKNKKGSLFMNFFHSLERRLDIVVYRSGFAKTVAQARQLIQHRKIQINGNLVRNPSIQLNPGDVISLAPERIINLKRPSPLLHSFGNKTMQESSLVKILTTSPEFLELKKRKGSLKFLTHFSSKALHHSKTKHVLSGFVFHCFIQLLSTRIKRRSLLHFKHFSLNAPSTLVEKASTLLHFFHEKMHETPRFSQHQSKILLALKWKSRNRFNFGKGKNHSQNEKFSALGYLLKKPIISNGTSSRLPLKHATQSATKFRNSFGAPFLVNKETRSERFKNSHRNLSSHDWNRQRIASYRKSFLVFIKHLDTDLPFSYFLSPLLKKGFLKKSLLKKKRIFLKHFTFRVIKPIHLEISYKILEIIYLFSPQRLNFPFCIDLEIIQRSVR
jgi:ribosomal protein S4